MDRHEPGPPWPPSLPGGISALHPPRHTPTSQDRSDTGHLPTTIVAAFQQAGTLAVHLTLVLAQAELGEVSVHLGAGTLLFWGERSKGEWSEGMPGDEHLSTAPPPSALPCVTSCRAAPLPELIPRSLREMVCRPLLLLLPPSLILESQDVRSRPGSAFSYLCGLTWRAETPPRSGCVLRWYRLCPQVVHMISAQLLHTSWGWGGAWGPYTSTPSHWGAKLLCDSNKNEQR